MTTVPLGKAARATRAVSAGIVPIGSGRRLMADPSISREGEDHAPGRITVQFADSIYPTLPTPYPLREHVRYIHRRLVVCKERSTFSSTYLVSAGGTREPG